VSDETLGRYSLIRKIATGGMAEIWLAASDGPEGFRKKLVVKRILPNLAEDEEFVRMFLDEARIAARLNHPNIAQIFDLGEADGSYYIAMEYVPGKDLRRVYQDSVKAQSVLPVPLTLRILVESAKALDYAHHATDEQGQPLAIVHRDVSPQNILVTYQGGIKVVDFGIAKAADQATHTRSGVLKGKYSYMSPEQAAGDPVDKRTDVFALGIVGYELSTGFRLFKRDNEVLTLQAVRDCKVPLPSSVNSDVPRGLDAILMKALARRPDARFATAGQLAFALEEFLLQGQYPASSTHLAEFMRELYPEQRSEESGIRPAPTPAESQSGSSERQVPVHASVPPPLPGGARTRTTLPKSTSSRSVAVPVARSSSAPPVPTPQRSRASWRTAEDESLQTETLDRANLVKQAGLDGSSTTEAPTRIGSGITEAPTRTGETDVPTRIEESFRAVAEEPPEDTPVDTAATSGSVSEPRRSFALVPSFGPHARRFALRFSIAAGALVLIGISLPTVKGWIQQVGPQLAPNGQATKAAADAGCLLCGLIPQDQGKITVVTNPSSNVYLGDESLGATPVVEAPVASGHLELRIVNDTVGLDEKISADVKPNQLTTVKHDFAQGSLVLPVAKGHSYQVFFRDKPLGHVPGPAIQLVEGSHVLTLVDDKSGARESRTVEVKPAKRSASR
jgi:serine/threonine protein kinase